MATHNQKELSRDDDRVTVEVRVGVWYVVVRRRIARDLAMADEHDEELAVE